MCIRDRYRKEPKKIDDLLGFPDDNPNPVFRVSSDLRIIYSNKHAKILLQKLDIKGIKIPKKIFNHIKDSIKKKNDNLMTLVFKVDASFYEFSIVKVKDADCYNIYGNDITGIKNAEKSEQKIYRKAILLSDRNYIARELHDTVTQTLFSANLIAEVLPKLWKKDPRGVIKRLDEIRTLNNIALTEMRALLFDLRPSSFKTEELKDLIKELVKSVSIKLSLIHISEPTR